MQPDTAREALERAIAFIAKEYRDPALEPEGEWLPTEARKVHAQLVAALAAPSPTPARPDLRLEEDAQGRRAMLGGYQMPDEFIPSLETAPAPASLDDVAREIVRVVEEKHMDGFALVCGAWVISRESHAYRDILDGRAKAINEAHAASLRRAAGTDEMVEAVIRANYSDGLIAYWRAFRPEVIQQIHDRTRAALQAAAKARVS